MTKPKVKEYYVVIRRPKQKGPTVWTGPNQDVKTYKDMEGWNRIKSYIENKLTQILGDKPEWVNGQNAFKLSLTDPQAEEVKMWPDVKGVIDVK
jgi:hypothetical protein